MTALDKIIPFSLVSTSSTADYVSSDTAALASHMTRCTTTRSRFFAFHSVLEAAHSVVCARMVTAALLAAILIGVISIV